MTGLFHYSSAKPVFFNGHIISKQNIASHFLHKMARCEGTNTPIAIKIDTTLKVLKL